MMLGVVVGGLDPTHWLANGGVSTLTSYGGTVSRIPEDHMSFFRDLLPYYEAEKEIFVHACYDAKLPMSEQTDHVMYWTHLGPNYPPPHQSGKRVFVGHTPQREVLDLGYLICLDTYCFGRGYLTAMDLDTYDLVQVDYHGHLRRAANGTENDWLKWLQRKLSRFLGAPAAVDSDDPISSPVTEPPAVSESKNEDLAQSDAGGAGRGIVIENQRYLGAFSRPNHAHESAKRRLIEPSQPGLGR